MIQHISGTLSASGPIAVSSLASLFFPPPPQGGYVLFDQPVLIYWDAGTTPYVQTNSVTGFLSNSIIVMTGYMLDCSVAPCAPIAQ